MNIGEIKSTNAIVAEKVDNINFASAQSSEELFAQILTLLQNFGRRERR